MHNLPSSTHPSRPLCIMRRREERARATHRHVLPKICELRFCTFGCATWGGVRRRWWKRGMNDRRQRGMGWDERNYILFRFPLLFSRSLPTGAGAAAPIAAAAAGWTPGSLTWSIGSRTALLRGCSSVEPVVLVAMAKKALAPTLGPAQESGEGARGKWKKSRCCPPPLPSLIPRTSAAAEKAARRAPAPSGVVTTRGQQSPTPEWHRRCPIPTPLRC